MIYCFSGTGNTERVVHQLAKKIGSEIHRFSADELRHPSDSELSSSDYLIVWAFPTYSWGVPPVVRAIIREARLNFPENAVHIAVTTCGDDIGNLASMFRSDINRRGMNGGAVFSVQMPNTYVMMKGFDVDTPQVSQSKISASESITTAIAEAIRLGKITGLDDVTVKGAMPWIKTAIVYPWFIRYRMSPRGFNVDNSVCIGCGRCAKVCPMDNVTYDAENHPLWGDKCAFCTACYHSCPIHAIGWKATTRTKGQKQLID